jgi:hypothetical protein
LTPVIPYGKGKFICSSGLFTSIAEENLANSFVKDWIPWFKLIISGTQMQKQHAISSIHSGNVVATISILVITTITSIITG